MKILMKAKHAHAVIKYAVIKFAVVHILPFNVLLNSMVCTWHCLSKDHSQKWNTLPKVVAFYISENHLYGIHSRQVSFLTVEHELGRK